MARVTQNLYSTAAHRYVRGVSQGVLLASASWLFTVTHVRRRDYCQGRVLVSFMSGHNGSRVLLLLQVLLLKVHLLYRR